jgi:hypothetical protein
MWPPELHERAALLKLALIRFVGQPLQGRRLIAANQQRRVASRRSRRIWRDSASAVARRPTADTAGCPRGCSCKSGQRVAAERRRKESQGIRRHGKDPEFTQLRLRRTLRNANRQADGRDGTP